MIQKKHIALCALLSTSAYYAMEKEQLNMKPIKEFKDVKQFAGSVVAYKTTIEEDIGYMSKENNQTYLYVHKKPAGWEQSSPPLTGRYIGYGTKKLLNINDSSSSRTLTSPNLSGRIFEANFFMRNITADEKKIILTALKNNNAKFDELYPGTEEDQVKNIILSLID